MKFKSLIFFITCGLLPSLVNAYSSASLVTPSDLMATKNGRITPKEHQLMQSLSGAISQHDYEKVYNVLNDLYNYVQARSELFVREIPTIVNPVGKKMSRMIQVTRSNQIDSIMTLDAQIEKAVKPLRDRYHQIMREYHNRPKEMKKKDASQMEDKHVEAERIYSNVIMPADTVQKILERLERLFIIAHLRNFYFLTTKQGSFGSERDMSPAALTGQHYSPYTPPGNQRSGYSRAQDKELNP